jgi:3-hydroxyacyl-[acyl-carrier-protein] dehydratase
MPTLENTDIRDILPHRYPMLLVDRIVEIEEDRIVGLKNVTANEGFFQGHFPEFPVMPGVLIIEAMAQVGGVLVLKDVPDRKSKLVLFAAIEEAKFRKPVLPGDQLRIEMRTLKRKATVVKMQGEARVEGQVVAEAIVMCKVVDRQVQGSGDAQG